MCEKNVLFLFDIDDTMYDQKEVFFRSLNRFETENKDKLLNLSREIKEAIYIKTRELSDKYLPIIQENTTKKSYYDSLKIKQAFDGLEVSLSYEEAVRIDKYYKKEQKKLKVVPEMMALWEFLLEHNIEIGVITNGDREAQREKIRVMGLGRYITESNLIVSGDIGHPKPAKEIFAAYLEKCGNQSKKIYYIGDSYENDALGAVGYGWNSIWLNKYGKPSPIHPDIIECQSYAAILDRVKGICEGEMI